MSKIARSKHYLQKYYPSTFYGYNITREIKRENMDFTSGHKFKYINEQGNVFAGYSAKNTKGSYSAGIVDGYFRPMGSALTCGGVEIDVSYLGLWRERVTINGVRSSWMFRSKEMNDHVKVLRFLLKKV
jgi:hypothetical protein